MLEVKGQNVEYGWTQKLQSLKSQITRLEPIDPDVEPFLVSQMLKGLQEQVAWMNEEVQQKVNLRREYE